LHARSAGCTLARSSAEKNISSKHTSNTVQAVVTEIEHRINITTLEPEPAPPELGLNDIGEIRIRTARPIVF